jgi:hypothetical protein
MKHLRQTILISSIIILAGFILAACASSPPLTPEPQKIIFVTPTQPATLSAQPAAVIEPAAQVRPTLAETEEEIDPVVSTTSLEWAPDGPAVEGTESTLVRMEHGLYAMINTTGLEPGDAVTLWWVIFNKPENCSNGQCGEDDVFLVDETGAKLTDDVGASRPNVTGRAATEVSQLSGPGTIVDEGGRAKILARLPVGDTNETQFGSGLLYPMTADVHLILRTHGPAVPSVVREQLTTEWGGCPEGWPKDPCRNVQLAVHVPPGQ